MGILNGIGIVNNLIAGTLSGAALQTYLGTGSNYASFVQAINSRSQARAIAESSTAITAVCASALAMGAFANSSVAMKILGSNAIARAAIGTSGANFTAISASSTAIGRYVVVLAGLDPVDYANMTAVAASSTAMSAVAASSTAMNAVIASSTAMNAVTASSTAMNAVIASTTAKMACFNADTALNAFAASGTAMAALRAAGAQYAVYNATANGTPVTITGPNAAGRYILLGVSKNGTASQGITTITTRRSGSAIANSVAAITNASSTAGADMPLAVPIATPFTFTSSTVDGYQWYFGMLRCDV